jgi:hypothetical protein
MHDSTKNVNLFSLSYNALNIFLKLYVKDLKIEKNLHFCVKE